MEKVSMWEWLKAHDILEWLRPLWDGGGWYLKPDGKLTPNRAQVAIDTPWVHHGHTQWARCHIWSKVIFQVISQSMGKHFSDGVPFVPSGCQGCYKVVVRPRTLVQLFALDDLEAALGHPSKCGIEVRQSVHGLYGGYFYNAGLEAGLACYDRVRSEVDADKHLGPDVAVILKRGCTEMEHACGPSDQWAVTPEQEVVEALVDRWVEWEADDGEQPEPVVWMVKRRWIEFAFANGDETYKQFTGGKPIVPGYVTYHGRDRIWDAAMSGAGSPAPSRSVA